MIVCFIRIEQLQKRYIEGEREREGIKERNSETLTNLNQI